MNSKQNPFSLYDFLGYLLPGALCIYLLILGYPVFGISLAAFPNPHPSLFKHPDGYIPFIIVAYVIGHSLSFASSMTVERYAIWAYGYPSRFLLGIRPTSILHGISANDPLRVRRILVRVLVTGLCFPFTSLDIILERLIRIREIYVKALDPKLCLIIKRKISLLVLSHSGALEHCEANKIKSSEVDMTSTDYFRLVYHFALEACQNHVSSLKNYVSLYGFLRTMALLATVFFWASLIKLGLFIRRCMEFNTDSIPMGWEKYWYLILVVFISWMAAYLFLMAFVKFYRRYTLEAFMALAAHYPPQNPPKFNDPYAAEFISIPITPPTTPRQVNS